MNTRARMTLKRDYELEPRSHRQSVREHEVSIEVNAKDSMLNDLMSARKDTWFYFEYFPPRTDEGVKNLYKRILRMKTLNPLFLDFK